MQLSYKKLRDRYLNLFDDDNKCDFVLTDVLFAFNEIYPLINSNKVNKILEVVDLPLVPVITILLENFLTKKKRSRSVIILFLNLIRLFLFLDFAKLIPGLKII